MVNPEMNRDGRITETRKSSSPMWLIAVVLLALIVVAAFAFGLVDVNQTKMAALPDVKVETSGGQAPAFDVKTADINVGTKTKTIEVPTVSVDKTDEK